MCTAIAYNSDSFYFGRTLDYDFSFNEEVAITPRNCSLKFRNAQDLKNHYAIIGMSCVLNNYPLYYDAMNEKGLCMAGLNFVGNAKYNKTDEKKKNITHFELIPWILSQCSCVDEAKDILMQTNITNEAYNSDLPIAELHWLISDKNKSIVIESVKAGLKIHENHIGVLTNNPPFDMQLFSLNNFINLSVKEPENVFSDKINLNKYSHGMGAIGLPGDYSSQSRFIKAAFIKLNSPEKESQTESISQFFHILNSVEQPMGCCILDNGKYEKTIYTSCCCAESGIYCYTSYNNRQITAVNMKKEDLNGKNLIRFPLIKEEQINYQN
mgnify:CR=1 FL=1